MEVKVQKFKAKLKNVPTNASQVCSSTNLQLNKDESLSVADGLKDSELTLNNPEVNLRLTNNQSLQQKVFVLSLEGLPLMPTKPSRARKMIKSGKAKVVKRSPFTIQLLIKTDEVKQEVTLGIDTGYGNIGFSAVSEKEELISGTLKLDMKTKDRIEERAMYRNGRRNMLWYREPRFNNRATPKGWLAPSVQRRYDTHLTLIERIKKLLPITKVILEIAKFDIQKIENPEIEGKDYQRGDLLDYQNVRSYLMSREKGLCQFCHKDFKNQPSHIHHIVPRSKGGNDRVNNLAILHEKCHNELHKKHLEKSLKSNSKDYKHSTFMNIINKRFWNGVKDLEVTYGNITFVKRNKLKLAKTHFNDAFVIAKGDNQVRTKPFEIQQVHRNNRVLQVNRKGFKPSIKREKSKVNPGDLVLINHIWKTCKSMHCKGTRIIIEGKSLAFKLVTQIFHFGSLVWN